MNNLLELFTNSSISNTNQSLIDIENTTWITPMQEKENKLEEIYEQFLNAQESWDNNLTKKVEGTLLSKRKRKKRNLNEIITKERIQNSEQIEIKLLTLEQLVLLTPNKRKEINDLILKCKKISLSMFNSFQIQAFQKKQIIKWKEEQLQAFTPQQISWLSIENFKILQIQALTSPQINYLSIINLWTEEQKTWLTAQQIPAIIFDSIVCKTPNEINNIPTEEIKYIELIEI